jgi:hypothetical protein
MMYRAPGCIVGPRSTSCRSRSKLLCVAASGTVRSIAMVRGTPTCTRHTHTAHTLATTHDGYTRAAQPRAHTPRRLTGSGLQ